MPSRVINQNWVFGRGASLSVTGAGPTVLPVSVIDTREGCASISDSSGQLILYTDGVTIWDRYGTPQVTGLHGDSSSTQSALVVPDPGDPNQYYVFTIAGYTSGPNFHHFDGVRVRVTSGTWPAAIPLSNIMSMPSTTNVSPTEKLTALWHRDCVDIWVITMLNDSPAQNAPNGLGIFRVFRLTPTGLSHVADMPINVPVWDLGYLRSNRSGSRLAFANSQANDVWVYNFNNFSEAVDLASPVHTSVLPGSVAPNHARITYGVEFSPSGDLLYYSVIGSGNTGNLSSNDGYIFQVQLGATTTPPSVLIQTYSNPSPGIGSDYAIGALQLGNDDVIYIAKDQETTLGAIVNSDAVLCTVNMNFVSIAPGTCQLGLPNLVTSLCDCRCGGGCFGFARRMIDRMRPRRRPNVPDTA